MPPNGTHHRVRSRHTETRKVCGGKLSGEGSKRGGQRRDGASRIQLVQRHVRYTMRTTCKQMTSNSLKNGLDPVVLVLPQLNLKKAKIVSDGEPCLLPSKHIQTPTQGYTQAMRLRTTRQFNLRSPKVISSTPAAPAVHESLEVVE